MNPFKSALRYLATTGTDVEVACWLHMEDDDASVSTSAVVDMVRESQVSLSQKDALHVKVCAQSADSASELTRQGFAHKCELVDLLDPWQ